MNTLKIDSNDGLFEKMSYSRSDDLQMCLVWHQSIDKRLFDFLVKVQTFPTTETGDQRVSNGPNLLDCLNSFKQTETLDEDNMWYCNKCKDHVQANKTLEIFKTPRIMVISLKRFKASRKISWGGSRKVETHVDFPLEGLDMSPYVLSDEQKGKPLIYDCFGISNHFGGLGGGHYTAFAKNCFNG